MRTFTSAAFLLSLSAVFAFTQATPADQTSGSKATVYVYRYKQFVGSALSPSVFCDESQLARMDNGRYFAVKLDPGSHSFRSNDPQSGVALDLKAGQDYFIRVDIAAGMLKGHGRLSLTAPEQGRYELQSSKLKPLDNDKVVDHAHVSVEEAKFETLKTPAASAAAQAAAQTAQARPASAPPSAGEEPVHEVTLSDQSASDTQTSLADAARQAREKKATATAAPSPQ